jgi:hypothetical protein
VVLEACGVEAGLSFGLAPLLCDQAQPVINPINNPVDKAVFILSPGNYDVPNSPYPICFSLYSNAL